VSLTNIPSAFLLKTSNEKPKQNSTFYYTHRGSDAEPTYSLRHPDPDLPGSKNRYAAALYDSHNPDVLFAEVLLIPDWTQPSLSAEAIRLNGGVAPPPEPILPGEFVVQLYNPDQQVKVKQKAGSWGSAPSWEFEMPQQSFRQPSTSSIDRAQNDPAASELTPKIGLKWKKDSKFAKDLACFLSGKTVNADGSRRRNKEPDITVAIFKALKEITLYEPNLQRVEIEDLKGFEVVLLLSAVVIRDVYFGQMEQVFNISDPPGARAASTSPRPPAAVVGLYGGRPLSPADRRKKSSSSSARPIIAVPPRDNRIPPTDPRSQWEIDAETARLKKQAEAEERERKRRDVAEQKRIKKMLEAEEKEKKRKQAEIDKETERLKRIYGNQGQSTPTLPARPVSNNNRYPTIPFPQPNPFLRPQSVSQPGPPQVRWGPPAPGPYLQVPGGYPSQSAFFGNSGPGGQQKLREKRSFFGFRRENDAPKLLKKKSSVF
jgi:hypothetical protein